MEISIDPGKSVYENATGYFDTAKKLKKKAIDTEKAIAVSERELQEFETKMKKTNMTLHIKYMN